MATIDQYKKQFTESERALGHQLLQLGFVNGRYISSKSTALLSIGSPEELEHVKIRITEEYKDANWNCTCSVFEEKINCRHIWAALLFMQDRLFFYWPYGQKTSDLEQQTFDISENNPRNSRMRDDYIAPKLVQTGTTEVASPDKQEALFVLKNPNEMFEDWTIGLHYRNCYKDGSRGRWNTEDDIYHIDYSKYDSRFKKALKAYSAAHEKARYEPLENTFSPEIWGHALSEISKTNALRYIDDKISHLIKFIDSSNNNPLEFEIKGALSAGNMKVIGSFVSRGLRIPITKSTKVINQSFAIEDGRLFCINHFHSDRWIEQIKKHQPLTIEKENIGAFLSSIYSTEVIPRLSFPIRYSYKSYEKTPSVRLVIERSSDNNLCAELEFKYGNEYFDRRESSHRFLDHDKKTIHVRQISDERDFRNRLFGMLERKHRSPGGLLLFKESKLLELVNAAFDQKWEVVAFKKQVSQMSDYKLKASSGIDWFDLHLDMKFTGGTSIPLPDLLRGLKSGKKMLTLADGSLGVINEDVIKKFSQLGLGLKIVKGKIRVSKTQALYLSSLLSDDRHFSSDQKFKTLAKVRELSRRPTTLSADKQFRGKLRGYQKKGLGWLDEMSKREIGCLLADDMGLGKTVSILALLSKRLNGQALVVVPKTLISNWLLEAEKFVPHLNVYAHYGSGRNSFKQALSNADVIITTYHTLRTDVDQLKKINFDFLVADEAQWIKNPNSDIHKACRLVSAKRKIALTGTPIENSIGDLFAILNVVTPGLISKGGWEKFADADDPLAVKGVRHAIAPFILRRRKEDVLKELPKKTTQVLYSNLNTKERRDYNHLREYLKKAIKGEIDKNGISKTSTQILTALLRLRQAASHQGLLKKNKEKLPSSKFDLLMEHLETIVGEGHKVIIFSNFRDVLRLLSRQLSKKKIGFCYMDGTTANRQEIVQKFQTDAAKKAFLMTIKTGGVGLNLTSASYVFIMDPWWNPATETQAIDRTHRIGQKNRVTAYKLIAKDTVEEKVLALQAKKSSIAKAITEGEDSKVLKNISEEDLMNLFS